MTNRDSRALMAGQGNGLLLALGVVLPLLAWEEKWTWMLYAILLFLILYMFQTADSIALEDQWKIRFNVMEPLDVLQELVQMGQSVDFLSMTEEEGRISNSILLAGLESLAKKYGQEQASLQVRSEIQQKHSPKKHQQGPDQKKIQQKLLDPLAVICQQAAHVAFLLSAEDDAVVAASLSLLALVAGHEPVRTAYHNKSDKETSLRLDRVLQCLTSALKRAQEDMVDESNEQQQAELQRKGCLLLGALTDGDSTLSRRVVEVGGILTTLGALDWYRCHADVANWALWALFILCYENQAHQVVLVENDGVSIVVRVLGNVGRESTEASRHGLAVLFDLMREQTGSQQPLDVWKIRSAALAAGLHKAVSGCMEEHRDAVDIIMMGQAILSGTDYQGHIPQYELR